MVIVLCLFRSPLSFRGSLFRIPHVLFMQSTLCGIRGTLIGHRILRELLCPFAERIHDCVGKRKRIGGVVGCGRCNRLCECVRLDIFYVLVYFKFHFIAVVWFLQKWIDRRWCIFSEDFSIQE